MRLRRTGATATIAAAVAALVASGLSGSAPLPAVAAPFECTDADGPVVCKQCSTASGKGVIHTLPRVDKSLSPVSSNWGDYTDTWELVAQQCVVANDGTGDAAASCDVLREVQVEGDGRTFRSYGESLAVYAGFGVVVALLFGIGSVAFCCGRYCCGFVAPAACDIAGCCNRGAGACGGRYPTEKRGEHCCAAMGFKRGVDVGYTPGQKWCARIYMWVWCIFVLTFLALGQLRGNNQVVPTLQTWAEAPQGVINLVDGAVEPMGQLIDGVASDVVVHLMQSLNETVLATINPPEVLDALACVIDRVDALPELSVFTGFLDDLQGRLDVLTHAVNEIEAVLDSVAGAQATIVDASYDVTYSLGNVSKTVVDGRAAVTDAEAAVSAAQAFAALLTNDVDGIGAIQADFLALGSLPPAADLDAASTAGSNSLASIQALPNEDGAVLHSRLQALVSAYTALPNYTITAENMQLYNARIAQANADRILENVAESVTAALDIVDGIRGTSTTLNASTTAMINAAAGINIDPALAALYRVQNATHGIDFAPLMTEVAKVYDIPGVVPCMAAIGAALRRVNESIVALPAEITVIVDLVDEVNTTLAPAVDRVSNLTRYQDDYEENVNNVNVTEQIRLVQLVRDAVPSDVGSLEVGDTLAQLKDAEDQAAGLNVSVSSDVDQLRTTMNNNLLSDDAISKMRLFEQVKAAMVASLSVITADVGTYTGGYCASGVSAGDPCADDSACGGGAGSCIGYNTKRCAAAPATACGGGGDDDCTPADPADRCLVDNDRFQQAIGLLQAVKNAPDVGNEVDALSATEADAVDVDGGSFTHSAGDAKAALDSVDVRPFQSQVGDIRDSVTSFDVSSSSGEFDSIESTLDRINIADARDSVLELNGTFTDVRSQVQQVQDAKDFVEGLSHLLHTALPPMLTRLDYDRLEAVRAEAGLGGVALAITEVLDDATAAINASTPQLGDVASNFTAEYRPTADSLEVLSAPRYRNSGPLYFLGSLANKNGMMNPGEPGVQGGRVYADSTGAAYPDDRICLLRECVNAEIEWADSAPLDQVIPQMPVPLSLSRSQAVSLPLLLVLLTMLLGFAASVAVCNDKLAACLSNSSWLCIACQTPILFAFAGSLWALVMVTGDACYGVENAGYRVLQASGDAGCQLLPGGFGSLEECTFALGVPVEVNVTVDVGGMFLGVTGGDCGDGGGHNENDPTQPFWASLADAVEALPPQLLADVLNGTSSAAEANSTGTPLQLRPQTAVVLEVAAARTGAYLRTFVSDLSGNIGCNNLHAAYSGLKDAMCCQTLDTFYWSVGALYWVAFANLVCGCCASVIGVKRFRAQLWGKEYERAMSQRSQHLHRGGYEMGAVAGAGTTVVANPLDAAGAKPSSSARARRGSAPDAAALLAAGDWGGTGAQAQTTRGASSSAAGRAKRVKVMKQ